jgi:hypothetical protein
MLSGRLLIASLLALVAGMALAFVASAAQRGADSTVTIYYTAPDKFDAKVNSAEPACLDDRAMKFKRVRKGRDLKLAEKTTDNGGWATKLFPSDIAKGKYYAKVGTSSFGGGTCLPAKSGTTTVPG